MEVTQKPHLHQDWIDSHAYGIVKALQKGGFTTYLVGGCVRDLLLGIHPKDYDIVTMAHPPQVKRLIYMAFIIGKRFRLVLVKRGDQQFEVATFRSEKNVDDLVEGEPPNDNIFGTPEEDAERRDFTINGLFYDPVNEQLIDYVNGLADIDARILRMIGEPEARLIEDPIRTLRGIRLAHKLGLVIEPSLRAAMEKQAPELLRSVLPRRREEILKILRLEEPDLCLLELFDLGILKHVIPTLHDLLSVADRREAFLLHFNAYRSLVVDFADTTQLFGWLVYSILQTALAVPTERDEPLTIEDEIFQRLMRDDLGMFKFEQTVIAKAVEIVPLLEKTEDFRRRGERRQLALMKNEGFRLAVRFAQADFLLKPEQIEFWKTAFLRSSEEIEKHSEETRAKKRRRPRRRKPGERGERGEKTADGADSDEELDESDEDLDPDLPEVEEQPDPRFRADDAVGNEGDTAEKP